MTHHTRIWLSQLFLVLVLSTASATASAQKWVGPKGEPLPFETEDQILDFLQTATLVSREKVKEGINGVDKVLLERDGVQANACFRTISISSRREQIGGRFIMGFRDDFIFEVAAYRLDRLLGLDHVPPAVLRKVKGKKGSLQLWLDNTFTEKQRVKEKPAVPGPKALLYQMQTLYLFDNLIFNFDRNQGNIVYDSTGKMWFIDHGRTFLKSGEAPSLNLVRLCDKKLYESLQNLDRERVQQELADLLSRGQIKGLFKRIDEMVAHVQGLVDERGAKRVLF